MGAGKWRPEYVDSLAGAARVIVVADADKPGRDHARQVVTSLRGKVGEVGAFEPAVGKDVSDHLDAGRGLDELVPLRDDQADEPENIDGDNVFADLPPGLAAELQDDKLAAEVEKVQRVRRARQIADEIEALHDPKPAPDAALLSDLLTRQVAHAFRVDDLLPASGRLLLAAQRKTGKTIFTGNLAYSLITGTPFLGRFPVKPIDGRVIAMNYEVTGEQYGRWMDDIGIPGDRLFTINLRGRRNLLADEAGRTELVDMIREQNGEVLIVDPFGRAYTGKSQNDTSEVTPWLVRLDEVAQQAGIAELILTAHAGWDAERTRGASGLEDWADAIVTLVRDKDTDHRFMRAMGRDVELEEDRVDYDQDTRRLTLAGAGSRRQVGQQDKLNRIAVAVRDIAVENPGINVVTLQELLKGRGVSFQKGDVSQGALLAEHRGWIERRKVGRSMFHFPTTPAEPTPTNPDQPPGSFGRTPTPPYMGGFVRAPLPRTNPKTLTGSTAYPKGWPDDRRRPRTRQCGTTRRAPTTAPRARRRTASQLVPHPAVANVLPMQCPAPAHLHPRRKAVLRRLLGRT
jgi:hypothetical protein